jgi:hypothetical protein
MKNRAFLTAVMLLSVPLCFSSGTYAQTKDPDRDLPVVFTGTRLSGEWVNVNGEVTNNSVNSYPCVHINFSLYGRPADVRSSGIHLGEITVEVRDLQPRAARKFTKYLPNPAWTVRKKSVTECSAPQESQEVILYENPNFGGRSKPFGVGSHPLLPAQGFNDVASSIKVPAGLVVIVYEHSAEGVGYGLWVDFLEDQPNLAQYNLDNKISHLKIVPRRSSDSVWVRNSLQNGQFQAGYYHVIGRRGGSPPANPNPLVGPPKPPPNVGQQPPPTVCIFFGKVINDSPGYVTRIRLHRLDGSETPFWTTAKNGEYFIYNVPPGTYQIRATGRNYPPRHGVFVEGSSEVRCLKDGFSDNVDLRIGPTEG